MQNKTIYEMMEIAMADPNCAGFNSLGFFKFAISTENLHNISRILMVFLLKECSKEPELRKSNGDKTRVKMLCDWQSSKVDRRVVINDRSFVIELTTTDDADFHVIINKPGNGSFDPSKSIIYRNGANYL